MVMVIVIVMVMVMVMVTMVNCNQSLLQLLRNYIVIGIFFISFGLYSDPVFIKNVIL